MRHYRALPITNRPSEKVWIRLLPMMWYDTYAYPYLKCRYGKRQGHSLTIRKLNQLERLVPPCATSCKVSGTQAQTLKDTKSSFADYTLFFNGGFLSIYGTSYQKAKFDQMRLRKSFPYIYGSPNLRFFRFGSHVNRLVIA